MNVSMEQVLQILGAKEVENAILRQQLEVLQKRVEEIEKQLEPVKALS